MNKLLGIVGAILIVILRCIMGYDFGYAIASGFTYIIAYMASYLLCMSVSDLYIHYRNKKRQ